jgi:acyl-CoA synthetase (AMP-forming)/AMP-acid ligase II
MAPLNLADAFIAAGNYYRDRPAIVSAGVNLTHRQLSDRAMQTARVLANEGVRPGDIVGTALMEPGESVVAAIALWILGATVVFIDFRSRSDERAHLCHTFGISVVVEDRGAPGTGEYSSIRAGPDWGEKVEREAADLNSPGRSDCPAILSLTSGTTGEPQGIRIDHSTFLLRYMIHHVSGDTHAHAAYLNPLPLNYSASRNHTLGRLLDGGTVHFVSFLSTAEELRDQIISRGITYTMMVPTQLSGLLKLSEGLDRPMFPSLKTLHCGGAPMRARDQIRAYRELSRGYRVAYASSVVGTVAELFGDDIMRHADTVGRPLPLVNLQIVSDSGVVLPPGEPGHIRVRSPAIASGVVGPGSANSDRIVDGWAYPGDLGVLDEDGYLRITGRASDMIIRGGANVFPEEVEAALADHPAVAEVAVVGVAEENVGEEIAAFVVAKAPVTADELTAFARSRLSPDKRPRLYYFVEKLPRSAVGKVVRRELLKLVPQET